MNRLFVAFKPLYLLYKTNLILNKNIPKGFYRTPDKDIV